MTRVSHNPGSRGLRLQNRQGFTLILMAVMMAVLIGAAAFAVDFGKMYLYRAQLHTAADAGALAAAEQIMNGGPTGYATAADSAISYAGRHFAGGTLIPAAKVTVEPGTWTYGSAFVPTGGLWDVATAARVTTSYTGSYGFGRLFGLTTHNVAASADAAIAYVGATTCIRPAALPYQKLLDQLSKPAPPGTLAPSYVLTAADIVKLSTAGPADAVLLRIRDNSGSPTSGNYYGVQMGPFPNVITNGVSNYADDFGGPCSGTTYQGNVGPGDWLAPQNGVSSGPVENGFEELCGVTITGGGTQSVPCPGGKQIKVALWIPSPPAPSPPSGCASCFYVKYTGVFVVTEYDQTPGHGNDGIWGYFTAMPSDGSVSSSPGPLKKIALVR